MASTKHNEKQVLFKVGKVLFPNGAFLLARGAVSQVMFQKKKEKDFISKYQMTGKSQPKVGSIFAELPMGI